MERVKEIQWSSYLCEKGTLWTEQEKSMKCWKPHPAGMYTAVVDEIIRNALSGPGQLCETRVDFLIQELDSFAEQPTLFHWQRCDDSGWQKYVDILRYEII